MTLRQRLFRAALYGLSAVVITWPLALHPASHVVGGERTDVWNALWSYWFVAAGLTHGQFPTTTALLDFPSGGQLLVADPLNATLAAPITWIAGPALAYSVTVLLHLWVAGLLLDALGRRLGGNGWIAGLSYPWSAIVLSHLQNGSSEAAAVAWLPLAALLAVVATERGGGWTIATGLGLALCALGGGWYAGVGAFVFVGALALLHPGGRRLWVGIGIGALLLLPVAAAYQTLSQAQDGLVDIKSAETLERVRRTVGAADPRTFVTPGDFRAPDFSHLEQNASDLVHTAYLGFAVLGMAVWKGRSRALWVAALAGVLLAMGPVLVYAGGPVPWHTHALPLPYAILEHLPGFDGLSLVYRFATITPLALGLLADRAPGWLGALVVTETLLLSPARHLPVVSDATPPAPLVALAGAAPGAVVSLPAGFARTRLFEQTVHGHPLTASLNSGMNAAGLRVLADLRKVAYNQLTWDEAIRSAQALDVRYVVVHPKVAIEATFQTSVRPLREHATKLASDDTLTVWALY